MSQIVIGREPLPAPLPSRLRLMGSAFAVEAPEAEHSEAAQKLVNKLKGCPHFVTCRTKNETVEVDITLLGERRQKVVAQVDSMVESVMKLIRRRFRNSEAWNVSIDAMAS